MDYSAVITAAIRKALLFNILGRICGRPIWQEESLASALQPAVPACQDNDLMSLPDSPAHREIASINSQYPKTLRSRCDTLSHVNRFWINLRSTPP